MDDKTKLGLARKNGKIEDLYVQSVRKEVAKKFSKDDEIAILRKAVAYLFELISKLHSGGIDNEEFAIYYAVIEQIKSVERSKYNS